MYWSLQKQPPAENSEPSEPSAPSAEASEIPNMDATLQKNPTTDGEEGSIAENISNLSIEDAASDTSAENGENTGG